MENEDETSGTVILNNEERVDNYSFESVLNDPYNFYETGYKTKYSNMRLELRNNVEIIEQAPDIAKSIMENNLDVESFNFRIEFE